MDNIRSISVMKDLILAIKGMEQELLETCGVSLKGILTLCAIGNDRITASDIVERTGLRSSHVSKVTGVLEEQGLVERHLGKEDKRQFFFSLTAKGLGSLETVKGHTFEIPVILRSVFEAYV